MIKLLHLAFPIPVGAGQETEDAALVAAVEKEFARRGIVYGQRSDGPRQSAASCRTARWPEHWPRAIPGSRPARS